jgi:DNA-binding PadR family transcriptional regulator
VGAHRSEWKAPGKGSLQMAAAIAATVERLPHQSESVSPKQYGWCKTPHTYFLEWRRFYPGIEHDLLGIILNRTEGVQEKKRLKIDGAEWAEIKKRKFMQWTGASESTVQRGLRRVKKKGAIQVLRENGGRGITPLYRIDAAGIERYISDQKRAHAIAEKGVTDAAVSIEKRESSTPPRIKDSDLTQIQQRTNKRITGDESQKPAIRPPGHHEGACDFIAERPKADTPVGWSTPADMLPPAVAQKNPFPGKPTPEVFPDLVPFAYETHLAALRAKLRAYMNDEPPQGFEWSCFLAARGATVADICDLIDRKWAQKKFRPGRKYGPQKWAWFLTVIRKEFWPSERGRLPEVPAAEQPLSGDDLTRGIEAIEVSTADDSLVTSYTCKCGAEIRQYTSRIEGECTCQQNRRAPPGKETGGLGQLARATAIGT